MSMSLSELCRELPHYGLRLFTIRTVQDGDIGLWATRIEVTTCGALMGWAGWIRPGGTGVAEEVICFTLAAGQWTAVFDSGQTT